VFVIVPYRTGSSRDDGSITELATVSQQEGSENRGTACKELPEMYRLSTRQGDRPCLLAARMVCTADTIICHLLKIF
jgi:hypothetical protein